MGFNSGLATKIAIGLGGVSAIAGGGYAASQYLSGTKISDLLAKDEYVLLKKGEDEDQWKKRWGEYVNAKDNTWKLENYTTSSLNAGTVPDNFKDACIYNSSLRVTDEKEDNYKNVEKFCTKEFPISDLIAKDKSIETITASNLQGQKTKAKWSDYLTNFKTKDPLKIKNFNSLTSATVPESYKTNCDTKKTEKVKNTKDKNYLIFKDWCTILK